MLINCQNNLQHNLSKHFYICICTLLLPYLKMLHYHVHNDNSEHYVAVCINSSPIYTQ